MSAVLMIGATSAIGASMVKMFAARGCKLYLVGRHQERLAGVAENALVTGATSVKTLAIDLAEVEACQKLADWISGLPAIDEAVILPGVLSDEFGEIEQWNRDVAVNFTAPSFFARLVSEKMAARVEGGHLVLVGSVAGDRGRQSNGFYGAQKGALETYAAALRHRVFLENRKVKITFVKPGFVVSPMTATMKKNALFSEPDVIAQKVLSLLEKGRGGVVYAPGWWRMVMLVIKMVPNFIFQRSRL